MPDTARTDLGPLVYVDVSVCHANRHLPPVGITRAEQELVRATLADKSGRYRYCRYSVTGGGYVPVLQQTAVDLARETTLPGSRTSLFSGAVPSRLLMDPPGDDGAAVPGAAVVWVDGCGDDDWLLTDACMFVRGTGKISLKLYLPDSAAHGGAKKRVAVVVGDQRVALYEVSRGAVWWTAPVEVPMEGAFVFIMSEGPEAKSGGEMRSLGILCPEVRLLGPAIKGAGDSRDAERSKPEDLLREASLAVIEDGASVIVPGAPWNDGSMQWLAKAKQRKPLKIYTFFYDIVPLLVPEYCLPGMGDKFARLVLDAAWISDALFCISEYTRDSLRDVIRESGAPCPPLHLVRLGDTIASGGTAVRPEGTLSDLQSGRFLLFVSTIEARKNHALMFRVWRRMLDEAPDDMLPIVFVGRDGWRTDDLREAIMLSYRLFPEFIRLANDISDDELKWLYDNCRYTVYPSFFEGWGLPVVESLGHGKLCLASSSSSIPEAAQGLAELIDPDDFKTWFDKVRHYNRSDQDLARREAEIRSKFKPMDWQEAYVGLLSIVRKPDPGYASPLPPAAPAGSRPDREPAQ